MRSGRSVTALRVPAGGALFAVFFARIAYAKRSALTTGGMPGFAYEVTYGMCFAVQNLPRYPEYRCPAERIRFTMTSFSLSSIFRTANRNHFHFHIVRATRKTEKKKYGKKQFPRSKHGRNSKRKQPKVVE